MSLSEIFGAPNTRTKKSNKSHSKPKKSHSKKRSFGSKSKKSHSRSRKSHSHKKRSFGAASKSRKSNTIYVPKGTNPKRAKRLVFDGVYTKTRGGLTKQKLMKTPDGRIVSTKQHKNGVQLQKEHPFEENKKFLKNIR
jgi:hypothetical protein